MASIYVQYWMEGVDVMYVYVLMDAYIISAYVCMYVYMHA
jgi:hypothetical protein